MTRSAVAALVALMANRRATLLAGLVEANPNGKPYITHVAAPAGPRSKPCACWWRCSPRRNGPMDRPRLSTIIFEIMQARNHACLHCYNYWAHPAWTGPRLNGSGDLRPLLGRVLDQVDCQHVTLTAASRRCGALAGGGELSERRRCWHDAHQQRPSADR